MKVITLPGYNPKGLTWLYPIFDDIKNGILITNEQSDILYVNPAYLKLTGYTADEVIGQDPGMMRSGYHDEKFYKNIWDTLKNNGRWEGEIWNRNKDGSVFPVLLTITKLQNSVDHTFYYLAVSSDVSSLKAHDTQEMNLKLYDFLTKLPNKISLQYHFKKTVSSALEVINKLAVIVVDINQFKLINDQYGYIAGDKLLIAISQKIQTIIGNSDFIARFERDEFVILTLHINTEAIKLKIYDIFTSPFNIDGIDIYVSCSIGVATLTNISESLNSLITKAEQTKK